jgi:predicted nucleic acid-binding protein
LKIYLDVSCLNRPFDDQTQPRIRLEAEAVALILERCATGEWQQVSSDMAAIEIAANPDHQKRRQVRATLPPARDIIPLDQAIFDRTKAIQSMGIRTADAVHVAAAEASGADVLLTCDDKLERAARRSRGGLKVTVANPTVWLKEQDDAKNR